jgi:hypothetical protein
MMTTQERQKQIEYVSSFKQPAEATFIMPKQVEALNAEREKMLNTEKFINTVIETEDFEDAINKAVIEGKIYSASQYNSIKTKFDALDSKMGDRTNLAETIVNKTGQVIIMSGSLQERLGIYTDGFVSSDEQEDLANALQLDGVPSPEIDKVMAAMIKNGAVVMQRGAFNDLLPLLEETLGRKLNAYVPKAFLLTNEPVDATQLTPSSSSSPDSMTMTGELPISFIEYLKNTDREFDRVENEIIKDQIFISFFENLKTHFAYYKTLSAEKMAAEVIIRPQLWVKLSPRTRASVENIVTRNRPTYMLKINEVAKVSGADKLADLRKSLVQ